MSNNFLHLVYPNYLVIVVNTKVSYFAAISFAREVIPIDVPRNFDSIFNDKMQNLRGYPYKIVVGDQQPRLYCKDVANCKGIDLTIMEIIAEKQNAQIVLQHVKTDTLDWAQMYARRLGISDMGLITSARMFGRDNNYNILNTYYEYAFCAAVPIPPRLSFLDFLLVPFDLATWLTFSALVAACAIFWKLLSKPRRSALHFVVAVAANFIGQSIKLQSERKVLVLLLKLCLIMSFILGNAYQSLIIAFMMTSGGGVRFKTFEELIDSGIPIAASSEVIEWISIKNRAFQNFYKAPEIKFDEFYFRNFSFIARCDVLDLYFTTNNVFSTNMYILPEKIMKTFEEIVIRLGTHKTLQHFFDLIFETGIREHLSAVIQRQTKKGFFELQQTIEFIVNEKYFLTLADIDGIVFVFLGGVAISSLVFILEWIRYEWDNLRSLTIAFYQMKKDKAMNRLGRQNRTAQIIL